MQRRDFVKFCAASSAVGRRPPRTGGRGCYANVILTGQLIDGSGVRRLKASAVSRRPATCIFSLTLSTHPPASASTSHLAHPYTWLRPSWSTADQRVYEWKGGVGPRHSIVADSAICAHHPSPIRPKRSVSPISYRSEKSARTKHGNAIHCCWVRQHPYYPADGARVVAGPRAAAAGRDPSRA